MATAPTIQVSQYQWRPLRRQEARNDGGILRQRKCRHPFFECTNNILTTFIIPGAVLTNKTQLQGPVQTGQDGCIRGGFFQQISDTFPQLFTSIQCAEEARLQRVPCQVR